MFVINNLNLKNTITFPEEIGEWLARNGVPTFSINELGEYVFINTKLLKGALEKMPEDLKNKSRKVV